MDHTVAREDLKVISGLLEDWNRKGSIDTLEYDLLLDKIKSLYQAVRFGETDRLPSCAAKPEPFREQEARNDACPEVTPETLSDDREEATECRSFAGRPSFRALYDDQAPERTAEKPRHFEAAPAVAEQSVPEPGPTVCAEPETTEGASTVKPTTGCPGACEEKRPVLGEVIGSAGRTIADTLNPPVADLASRLGRETSLRRMIGLNDRYMFVRDLFGGDTAAYDDAIERLDDFDAIEDALLYIHDNYAWDSSSEAAVLLADMLARKLL